MDEELQPTVLRDVITHPWASYQIRKIAGCACAGNAGNIFPRRRFQSKSLVSDSDMHHGTCVTHVPWFMSGSLTRSDGENVPGACAPAILRIWQEAHALIPILHDNVIKWKYFPRYWPFVRRINWSPEYSPHKGLWRRALMFSLICAWKTAEQTTEMPMIWDAIALMTSL